MASAVNVFFIFLPLFLMGILFFIFWIIMLVDSATRKYKKENDKVVWVLVNVLVGVLGSFIYYFVIYLKDQKKSMNWFWFTLLGIFILFIVITLLVILAMPSGA